MQLEFDLAKFVAFILAIVFFAMDKINGYMFTLVLLMLCNLKFSWRR
jgi:hypothetical protein